MRPAPNASGETLSGSTDLKRSRSLLRALVTASAMSLAACGGGSNGNENPHTGGTGGIGGSAGEGGTGGIGGSAGEGGTGGMDAGGTGGTDAGDPCASKEFNGLASRVYQPGESGAFSVSLDSGNPDKAYNGMNLEVKDGALFLTGTRVGLEKVLYTNYQTGYGQIGNVSGVRPIFMDASQPYVDDGTGNCVPNLVDVNSAVLADAGKRPVMKTPEGYFTTVFKVEDSSETLADYTLEEDRTGFGLTSVNAKGMEVSFVMGNSPPSVPDTVSAHRDTDGHIVLSLAGTTDEGFGDDNVLAKLNATASGITFEPVPGEPGKFRSTEPSSLTNLDLEVEGLNRGLTDDKTVKSLTVTETDLCIGVTCEDNNDCTADNCDPADGTCDNTPDVGKSCDDGIAGTINDECNAGGVCVGEVVACTTDPQCDDGSPCNGVETCGTNNECVGGTPINYDDGNACNGVETCDPATGNEISGTPINYDDGNACNGVETCNPVNGSMVPGTPINYNDGLICNGMESCDPVTGNKINGTPINCGTDVCVEPGNCVDVTAPNAPVITTNSGNNFTTTQPSVNIQGTTDTDTDEMYSNINGGNYNLVPAYTAGSPNWSQTFGISEGQTNTYCFAAEDWSNNRSTTDCIVVERGYPAPVISGLMVDCSPTGGECLSNWSYSASAVVVNATGCTANSTSLGGYNNGSTSVVTLNGNNASFIWNTGLTAGDTNRVALNCNGSGGSDSEYKDVLLH